MRKNKFARCKTREAVLWDLRRIDPPLIGVEVDDALARIAELTPPAPLTVDEERREKAVGIVFGAMLDGKKRGPDVLAANRWLDRITNSLGITVADPEPAPVADAPCENCDDLKCMDCVARQRHDDCVDDCFVCCPAPVADALHHQCADVADDCCKRQPAPVVEAVEVDAETLRVISSAADWYHEKARRRDRIDLTIDGRTSTLYRDEDHKTRVVIWGGGAL